MKTDLSNMFADKIGIGLDRQALKEISDKLESVKNNFLRDKDKIAFTKLPFEWESLKASLWEAENLAENYSTLVVIGIGGSDLGAKATHRALNHQYYNELSDDKRPGKKIYFIGDTTDPRALKDLEEIIDLSSTLFLVISKSGNTIEQASTFIYFRDLVKKSLGEDAALNNFILVTDPESGSLRDLAKEHGYKTIAHPEVGGRFSVLSTVGMVPAFLAGVDCEKMLLGARELAEKLDKFDYTEDIALQYAAMQYLYFQDGKTINVLMPYNYGLGEFALWFRQLWAESLGKKMNNAGEVVNVGATPVAAWGPKDQHSQLQLYNEGPNDKTITFIIAKNADDNADLTLPEDYTGVEDFSYLKGWKFQDVLRKEMETTAFALSKNNRPNCLIEIDKIDAYGLGQLFYFFELVTTYMGYLFDINAFDQPGVELSKNAMVGVLGKDGFEEQKKEFEDFMNN